MKYTLDHDDLTPQEAAEKMRIKVDGVFWKATHIEFVRRKKGGQQWVYLKIVDPKSGMQKTIFMKRPQLYKAWEALFFGDITPDHVKNLVIEINEELCGALSVETVDKAGENWIEMMISCPTTSGRQVLALNHQDMINAFYAIFNSGSIGEMFENAFEMLGEMLE